MKLNSKEIDLDVRLTPDEAWRRITTESEQQAAFVNPSKSFIYRISGNEIIIEKVRRYYRNSFSSCLKMKIHPTDYGCRLHGSFSANTSPAIVIVLSLIFLGVIVWFWTTNIFDKLVAGQSPLNNVLAYLVPVTAIFGVLTMYPFGRFLARGEERRITEWLDNLFSDSIVKH